MSVVAAAPPRVRGKRGILRRSLRPLAYLWCPTGLLILFFLVPMVIMLKISFHHESLYDFRTGWTFDNYREIITDPIYRQVALDTFWIASAAMIIQLGIGLPLAYVMAFRAGRFELPLLLALVLADELNPIVRIYAWRAAAGPRGADQRRAAVVAHHQRAGGLAAVQQVRRDRRALDQLADVHRDPDLRRHEGDRRAAVRVGGRPRRRLVHHLPPRAAAAGRAGHLRGADPGLHPAVQRVRDAGPGRRPQRLHAGLAGQQPDPRAGGLGRRCGAELPAPARRRRWSRCSPTTCPS